MAEGVQAQNDTRDEGTETQESDHSLAEEGAERESSGPGTKLN